MHMRYYFRHHDDNDCLHAMGRGRRGRFGGYDDNFDPRHGGRFGGGRMFGHGDLKLVLLALISEQPRHGYELIRIIEDMFDGTYAPSPGAVYPTLTLLEEMGRASVEAGDGGRKCYAITEDGRAFLEANREEVEAVMARLDRMAHRMSRMRAPMAVRRAMHDLRHALLMRHGEWTREEAERICRILKQAAADIANGR